MRPRLVLALLVAAAVAASGAWATISTGAADADPEQSLVLPHLDQMTQKNSWPELVGQKAEEVKAALEAELPAGIRIFLVPQGSMVTMDFRTDRIRVFYDEGTQLVVTPPRIG
ncbi:hypothetical protein ABPG75_008304 [Micractinium tetrahymenae]